MKRAVTIALLTILLASGCSYRFRANAGGSRPGAGVEVQVGDQSVKVDTDGRVRVGGDIGR